MMKENCLPKQAIKNRLNVFDEAQNLNSETVELLRDGIGKVKEEIKEARELLID